MNILWKYKTFNIQEDKGFTLVELLLVIIVSGVLVGGIVSGYLSWNDYIKIAQTQQNLKLIKNSLSLFASKNYRIPCPKTPHKQEGNSNTCSESKKNIGLVPYDVLKLNKDNIVDGWGNYFTYVVDPTFTEKTDSRYDDIHAHCRTKDWIKGAYLINDFNNKRLVGGKNISPQKAKFCCSRSESVKIHTDTKKKVHITNYTPELFNGDSYTSSIYDRVDKILDPYNSYYRTNINNEIVHRMDPITKGRDGVAKASSMYKDTFYGGGIHIGHGDKDLIYGYTDMPIYVVISHGENGATAAIQNGIRQKKIKGGYYERQNSYYFRDAKIIWSLDYSSTHDESHFDDMLEWGTQTSLLLKGSRESCVRP